MGLLGMVFAASLGCGSPDPLAGLPARPFTEPGAPQIALLTRPMQVTLPAPALTAVPADGSFAVGPFTTTGPKGLLHETDWPFATPRQPRRAPPGVTLLQGEKTIPWRVAFQGIDPAEGGWRIDRGRLLVLLDHKPAGDELRLSNPGLREKMDRVDPERSGLPPEAFVLHEEERDGLTRNGLLLPAPTTITWDVDLPVAANWRAWLAAVKRPATRDAPESAVTLSVVADGATTEVLTHNCAGPGEPFVRVEADLSRWGGRRVTLRLSSAGEQGAAAFVGSPSIAATPTHQPRRVIVLAVDTLRPDHLGVGGYERPTSPELDRLAADSAVFDKSWAPAPRTRPSFRTATTGRWPIPAVGAMNIGEVFERSGFATGGVVANTHLNPRFGFDDGYDSWWLDGGAKADTEVDRALAFLEENRARDTFLFLHIMDPHLYYVAPEPFFGKFVSDPDPGLPPAWTRWQAYSWAAKGVLTDQRKRNIEALYDGEIAWTSSQIGRFLDRLHAMGDENTAIVFHSDHGEEFWEHGGYEHNHTVFDEVVRTALWVRPPGGISGGRHIQIPASLADIAPTLYGLVGITNAPQTDGIDLGPYVTGASRDDPNRAFPLGYLRYDRERWGIIADGQKYVLFTSDAREELYDLKTDPGEKNNLVPKTDAATLWKWRNRLPTVHEGLIVSPGYRIDFDAKGDITPWTYTFSEPVIGAGVMDPESITRRPVNQEWGEIPPKSPDDVGTVTLSADRRTMTFKPGSDASGILWVTAANPTLAGISVTRGTELLKPKPGGTATEVALLVPGARAMIDVGQVVVPPPDEAVLMAAVAHRKGGAADADDLQMLKQLGYIGTETH